MQPASASGATGGSNRQLKRWGPIAGVAAVLAIGAGVLIATGGDDEEAADTTTTEAVVDTTAPTTDTDPPDTGSTPDTSEPAGEITFPLTYSQAVEQGVEDQIEWGDRCDT
ncbi:MAG: hypothetical protein Q7V62_06090, partial [Actinomycetota bacterium]|nr:hypothetical protein [Actinomycetota bacterium]